MKEVTLSWALKETAEKGAWRRAFQERTDSQSKVWGPGYPSGAGLWDTLGAPWGWVGKIRQPW